jgi:hypothetical protein
MSEPNNNPSGPNPEIHTHPLVDKLHPDPDSPTDFVVLIGYPGPSREEGKLRLHLDLGFRSYIEIPRDGVILAEPTDREDENSPTRLFVRATATLEVVETSSVSGEAMYMQGAIASAYLAGAAWIGAAQTTPDATPATSYCIRPMQKKATINGCPQTTYHGGTACYRQEAVATAYCMQPMMRPEKTFQASCPQQTSHFGGTSCTPPTGWWTLGPG